MAAAGASRDLRLVCAAALLRSTAVGYLGVDLGLYLARRGLGASAIGAISAAGLAGVAAATCAVTWLGDRRGRRRWLVELALLGAVGVAVFAAASSPAWLAAAAAFGMVNAMGRDRGASVVLEHAAIPALAGPVGRTQALAWYNAAQDAGHAVGALLTGVPALVAPEAHGTLAAHRTGFGLYAILLVATAGLSAALSPRAEEGRAERGASIAPESRRILGRIALLFGLDGLGGGFLTTSLLSYFFFVRFGAGEGTVALLFGAARVANALSHLGAAWLARRIGLVPTMVFTHLPSSLLLVTVAVVSSFPLAATLFILREGLVEMDVPTRQSFVLAVVRPEERTFASGITNLVRLLTWAIGPALAGPLMERAGPGWSLAAGATMKIAYDLLLWRAFRRVRPDA